MELKDFIRETLVQIIQGGEEANRLISPHSTGTVFPLYSTYAGSRSVNAEPKYGYAVESINFDVALTTEESRTAEGGVKVAIAGIGGGTQTVKDSTMSLASRVQFTIPVQYPQNLPIIHRPKR